MTRQWRWAVIFASIGCASLFGHFSLDVRSTFDLMNAVVFTVLILPPSLFGSLMAMDLILRRTLGEADNKTVAMYAFRLGVVTAVVVLVALAQARYQPVQGFGVLAATVGGGLLWNTFADMFYLWMNHRRGPAKRPLQKPRKPFPITRAHRFPRAKHRRRRIQVAGFPSQRD